MLNLIYTLYSSTSDQVLNNLQFHTSPCCVSVYR